MLIIVRMWLNTGKFLIQGLPCPQLLTYSFISDLVLLASGARLCFLHDSFFASRAQLEQLLTDLKMVFSSAVPGFRFYNFCQGVWFLGAYWSHGPQLGSLCFLFLPYKSSSNLVSTSQNSIRVLSSQHLRGRFIELGVSMRKWALLVFHNRSRHRWPISRFSRGNKGGTLRLVCHRWLKPFVPSKPMWSIYHQR